MLGAEIVFSVEPQAVEDSWRQAFFINSVNQEQLPLPIVIYGRDRLTSLPQSRAAEDLSP